MKSQNLPLNLMKMSLPDGYSLQSLCVKVLDNNVAQLKNTLEKMWLAENKDHPAAIYMPRAVQSVLAMKISKPKQIALLLPLSGNFLSKPN
ncbi:penicillin-binding protein activator [Vibrio sp. PP-XX7]